MNKTENHLISLDFNVQSNPNKKTLSWEIKLKNFKIFIEKGNLLDQEVDIIVNPANRYLQLGGGVAGAIKSKCGNEVQNECDRIINKRGNLEISESVHTSSNNKINAKFIIHAVGPCWYDYTDKKECYNDLKTTFFNILMYAENKLSNLQSIAIPLISSGIFGVPKTLCCKTLYFAVEEYLTESNDANRNLKLVKLVNIDEDTNGQLFAFFRDKLSKIDGYFESGVDDKIKNDNKENNLRTKESKLIDNVLKCRMCDDLIEKNREKKIKCGCIYCYLCCENIEQGNKCECKLEKKKKLDN